MKKKKMAAALAAMLILSLVGCGGSAEKAEPEKEQTEEKAEEETEAEETEKTEDGIPVIESTVLFERDGIRVTAKELTEDPIWGLGLKVLVENDTEENVTVSGKSLVVNGYMMDELFSCTVAPGKKSNEMIDFSSSEFRAAGITAVSEIAVRFHVYLSDTFDTLFDTEEAEIRTSAFGGETAGPKEEGELLCETEGIRISGFYSDDADLFGPAVLLYTVNDSDRDIVVQCDSLSVNGFMVTPILSADVNAGRRSVDDLILSSSDMEANDIEKPEEIELVLKLLDADSYNVIQKTDPIVLTVR